MTVEHFEKKAVRRVAEAEFLWTGHGAPVWAKSPFPHATAAAARWCLVRNIVERAPYTVPKLLKVGR